ncbi:hypothetical protein [Arthrobacter woluwensis]|uniref:hypothetical protein n=1 Tax=Arthrobacter woluwensis TaxID=156980 RepID=UPI0037F5A440
MSVQEIQELDEGLVFCASGAHRPEYGAMGTRMNRAEAFNWTGVPTEIDLFSGYAVDRVTFPATDLDDVIDILTRLRGALAEKGIATRPNSPGAETPAQPLSPTT